MLRGKKVPEESVSGGPQKGDDPPLVVHPTLETPCDGSPDGFVCHLVTHAPGYSVIAASKVRDSLSLSFSPHHYALSVAVGGGKTNRFSSVVIVNVPEKFYIYLCKCVTE